MVRSILRLMDELKVRDQLKYLSLEIKLNKRAKIFQAILQLSLKIVEQKTVKYIYLSYLSLSLFKILFKWQSFDWQSLAKKK